MSVSCQTTRQNRDFECDLCGACCQTFPILVSIADSKREPRIRDRARELEAWLRKEDWHYQLFPLPFLDRCPFLGSDRSCEIYRRRPDACRRLEPGGEQCREARRRLGLEPLQKIKTTEEI